MKSKLSCAIPVMLMVFGMMMVPVRASAGEHWESEWGMGNFDHLREVASSPIFASPGIGEFWDLSQAPNFVPVADWSGIFTSASEISASGNSRDSLGWKLYLDDAYKNTPFTIEFYGYSGSRLIDWTTVSYDGTGDFTHDNNAQGWTYTPNEVNTVPVPATLLLFGSGLVGLAGLRKNHKS